MNNEGISLIDTKKGIPRLNFRFDKDYPEDGRIVFQFGEPFETVEDIIARRHCFF